MSTTNFDRIVEGDSHAELLAHGGMYHDLFKFQTNAIGFAPQASPDFHDQAQDVRAMDQGRHERDQVNTTSRQEKRVRIVTKVVRDTRYATFQMAALAVPRDERKAVWCGQKDVPLRRLAAIRAAANGQDDRQAMAKKKALVTGILGQDGAYLAKRLLEGGYEVYGAARRSSSWNSWRLRDLGVEQHIKFEYFELLEYENMRRLIDRLRPDEVYNLAAQSFVASSFEQPLYTADADAMGVLRLLEVCRGIDTGIRFYQASSSEMYGGVSPAALNENTPFHPRSPYAVAKTFGHHATVNYRESYGMHASAGILFNHESPLRGREFVTRKITSVLAEMKAGAPTTLQLGNLEAKRDWGFAGDYVEAIHLMVRADKADDYVVATGQICSVRDFVIAAAAALGFELDWSGSGVDEKAHDRKTGKLIVEISPEFFRPAEVHTLLGDASKARRELGWAPKVDFEGLVTMMARADYDRAMSGKQLM